MPGLTVAVTGGSGLVGSALIPFLVAGGHRVVGFVRGATGRSRSPAERVVEWDPDARRLDPAHLEGVDAVVHLSGESVAGGRWTEAKKTRIRSSRVQSTRLLCETVTRLARPPQVIVSASAVGYYGDRGAEVLREDSAAGSGFLALVCRDWEEATAPARHGGIRVVTLRIGMVLSRDGGALAALLTPFRLGAGGPVGSGAQYVSWITIDELLGVILHAAATESLSGPVNAVTPNPVTNLDFARTLGRVLFRPALMPTPTFAARLLFGEMADALLLASARVEPARLVATGYTFQYPNLEEALRHVLRQ